MMLAACLITLSFIIAIAALWWVAAVILRRYDDDLRYHREVLLHHIQLELKDQTHRLEEAFRQRSTPRSKGCPSSQS